MLCGTREGKKVGAYLLANGIGVVGDAPRGGVKFAVVLGVLVVDPAPGLQYISGRLLLGGVILGRLRGVGGLLPFGRLGLGLLGGLLLLGRLDLGLLGRGGVGGVGLAHGGDATWSEREFGGSR
jgi:hypothetical protein